MRQPVRKALALAALVLAPPLATAQAYLIVAKVFDTLREKLAALGRSVVMQDGDTLHKYLLADQQRYVELVRQANIELQ